MNDQEKAQVHDWLNYTGDDVVKKVDQVINDFGAKPVNPKAFWSEAYAPYIEKDVGR